MRQLQNTYQKVQPLPMKSEWTELKEQAILAYESGLIPRSIDTAQKAVTIALMGKEVGLSPLQSLCGIYVVNGMATLRGSLMLRLIYERVPGAQINILTPSDKADKECEVEMQRPNGQKQLFRYTLEDAKKAGFMQKPIWQLHTATMLRWAAIRTGARVVFADAIAGCYMEDEVPNEPKEAAPIEDVKIPQVPAKEEAKQVEIPEALPTEEAPKASPKEPPARLRVSDLPLSRVSTKPVTDKQVNRLFGIAYGSHWKRGQVVEYLQRTFGKTDPHQLNRAEYEKVCNYILDTPHSAEQAG